MVLDDMNGLVAEAEIMTNKDRYEINFKVDYNSTVCRWKF